MYKWRSLKPVLICTLVILFAAGVCGLVAFECSASQKLKRIGYNGDEITTLTNTLSEGDLNLLLETDYLDSIVEILNEPDFIASHLSDYITLCQKYNFTSSQIVALANHPDFDSAEEYTADKIGILTSKYYLSTNRKRYYDFLTTYEQDANYLVEDIIALVNANRDREFYQEPELASLENQDLILVNKYYYLPNDFEVNLVQLDAIYGSAGVSIAEVAYKAFLELYAAALEDGFSYYVTSGYRGYDEQVEVFNDYLARGDEAYALQYAAKPGFSEHQTGLALDIFVPGATLTTFGGTAAASWLAKNAYKFGFILRYPEGKENLTGYNFEPWHYRYVGTKAAAAIQESGLTLEEYAALQLN